MARSVRSLAVLLLASTVGFAAGPSPKDEALIRLIQCTDNLRRLAIYLDLYANAHTGRYPPDLGTLLIDQHVDMRRFVCPAGGGVLPHDWQKMAPADQAKWVNAHTDYIYLGAKWHSAEPHDGDPLIYEKSDDHPASLVNVVQGNGRTVSIKFDALQKVSGDKLKTDQKTTRVPATAGDVSAIPLITLDQAKALYAQNDIQQIMIGISAFELDNGRFPTQEQGLDAAVHKPNGTDLPNWRQNLPGIPPDPWGNPYQYKCPGLNNTDFTVFSCGPDGKPGTTDDVLPEATPAGGLP